MANLNNPSSILEIIDTINGKQDTLVSGTNIKTINNTSLLGSGNIDIQGGGGTATDVQINGTSITSNNVANIVTNSAYNASSNKIATMSDIPSDYLKNTATGSNAMTIGGTASSQTNALNIGVNSDANGGRGVALGYGTVATTWATAIGTGAKTTQQGAIQIGYGQNSTSNSLSVGFNGVNNYSLLDGTTGLIPYQRINSLSETRNNGQLKFWTGTKAQYDAISTKDSNTLYNIIDDQDITFTLLQTIYPVGSVYLSTNDTCPLASLFGTWTLVSSGKALWTGTGSNGGSTIEAGLPNITGSQSGVDARVPMTSLGALYTTTDSSNNRLPNNGTYTTSIINFDASLSNPIYGNSDTVQPPAYVVNVWRRTA